MVLETLFSDFKVSAHVDENEASPSPGPRWAHTFSALHEIGEAYLIGGVTSAKDLSALDESVYCLNLRTLKWEEVETEKGTECGVCSRRAFHTTTQVSDYELVVFGGWTGIKERDNAVYVFNALKREWTFPQISGRTRPEPRQGHSATKINAADIAVYGGWSGESFCDSLYILDTCAWSWTKVETFGISPQLADHTCYMKEWWLHFSGGFGADGENAMTHSLDLVTKEWSEQAESGRTALLDFSLDRIAEVGQSELRIGPYLVRFGGCDVSSGLYEDRNYSNVLEARQIRGGEDAKIPSKATHHNRASSSDVNYGPVQVDLISPRAYHSCTQASKFCVLAYGGRDKAQAFGDLWIIMLPEKIVLDQQAGSKTESRSVEPNEVVLHSRVHPSLLQGTAREERLIERHVARSQITDLVSDLRNSVADKDTNLKLERMNHRNKIEWLKEQIESVQTDLQKLHSYKESLDQVQQLESGEGNEE
ncbi:hypothetical protein A3770_12p66200 [Chloropicon primus]|uniref:Galactose oxidase n=1 Tax=Chloropicon primus TaxID=1764295 RepID=A0A5B8MX01_9CHLO|nr:hypothetical protein A3770_12p66200 [Chloropicon primus]|eukprot:QDZ24102.1 hypothetical protein A3770_12p66200 [Chloropicon primus]